MKVIIICLPRTGSSQLLDTVASNYKIKPFFESFSKNIPSTYFIKKDNFVLKTVIHQSPVDVNFVSISDWYADFCKNFDEVILLSRRDLKQCSESLAYYMHHKDINKSAFNYDSEYFWEKTPNYNEMENYVFSMDNDLKDLSAKIGKEIIYYEDIYAESQNERLRKGNKTQPNNII
jgi:hypothetical protein